MTQTRPIETHAALDRARAQAPARHQDQAVPVRPETSA